MLANCTEGADGMRVVWMILVNRALHGDKECPFSSVVIRTELGGGKGGRLESEVWVQELVQTTGVKLGAFAAFILLNPFNATLTTQNEPTESEM